MSAPLADRIPLVLEQASLLAEVTGRGVKLRRSGREMIGLCPIHPDRTPSFTVNADKGRWYCHGCQRGGDVINLVEQIDGVARAEAISKLADKYGVMRPDLREEQRFQPGTFHGRDPDREPRGRTATATQVLDELGFDPEELGRYLVEAHERLLSGGDMQARIARGYLRGRAGRNVGDDVRRWRLGIGPDSPNRKLRCLRNRIVFGVPPYGAEGRAVPGVEGHTWNASQKYITAGPKRAFGLDRINPNDSLLLVEGVFDVIALARAEVQAIALRGKSLHEDDARRLHGLGFEHVYVALDGDASSEDHRRLIQTLHEAGIRAVPCRGLDDGRDLGDLLALDEDALFDAVYGTGDGGIFADPRGESTHVVRFPLEGGGR